MRVLVTGASGFLGHYVLAALQRHGIEAVAAGRNPPTLCKAFIKVDLLAVTDFAGLVQQAQATHLLHLAWFAEHGKYWSSPLNLRWVDVTTRLVEAFCLAGGKQVVVAGTCAEYDWAHGYCREECTPLNSASLYGTTKDAARRLVMAVCAQHNVWCGWGRVFLPFGAGEASARLIPSLIEVFQGKRSPFGVNTKAYRDFLHASDVAEGFVGMLKHEAHGAFNISSGVPVALDELVREVAQQLGGDADLVLALKAVRLGEPVVLIGDNFKLNELGWRPKLSLSQGLAQTIQELR